MKPPKRKAKRIANHSKIEDEAISEEEDQLLTLIVRIIVDIVLKEMDDEEKAEIEKMKKGMIKGDNHTGFEHQ